MTAKEKTSLQNSDWLVGGGEMGALIREFDWGNTPLGPHSSWSPSLRMMVRFLLANRFPLLLWWGPQFIQIYNDPYRPVLGDKHPGRGLGKPVSECWNEIWHILRPLIETPFNGGTPTWMDDILLQINRYGFVEETHFTIAYSPVPDETVPGGIGGVLATVHEITEKVIGERRIVVLRDLGDRAVDAKTAEEACAVAAATLTKHPLDVPFALFYLIDPEKKRARLAGAAGVAPDGRLAPQIVELDQKSAAAQPWPLMEAAATESLQVVENLCEQFGTDVPKGPWSDPPERAVVLPIRSNIAHQVAGLFVIGISSRLRLDDSYRNFIELAADQVAAAIASAREYEAERMRAEALAEVDRAKTTFFSNVSHEFRTPLTLMLGPLEDALAEKGLPQRVQERLEVAHRNSQRLLKLVNTLLDFSRIEAGRIEAIYEPVDLGALTTDLASVFRSAIERAGLKLIVVCDSIDRPVYVDREMWEKIVFNLVSNAFKFTFDGQIEVGLRDRGQTVELSVSDTGTGIPSEELPRLFKRFHRVKDARGRSYEGSGIGLALVQELVKLHGGSVRVTSIMDKGSTFTISIPTGSAHLAADHIHSARSARSTSLRGEAYLQEALQWLPRSDEVNQSTVEVFPATGKQVSLESSSSEPAESKRILIADDNGDMREYLQRLLIQSGYEVVAVGDGEAALHAATDQSFHLCLADVMMPKLDGFGLLRALRDNDDTRPVPVILLSARAGEESRLEGLAAGADDYLVKPFSARELVARVESHLKLAGLRRQQEERMAADLQDMQRLHQVGAQCARAGYDFQRCLDEILDAAISITKADRGNIQLLDFKSGELRIAAKRGFSEEFLSFFSRVTDNEAAACGLALRAGARVIIEDVTQSETFVGRPTLRVLLEANVRAVQSTPLKSHSGQVFGMISTHFKMPHRPSDRELRLVDLLAQQTADFIERKRAEETLRQAEASRLAEEKRARQAAERATRTRDDFLALISHELRNPLNAIMACAHLLEHRRDDRDLTAKSAATIKRSAEVQMQLIEDLLDLARMTAGKLRLSIQPLNLANVVEEALYSVRPAAEAKGIVLVNSLDSAAEVAGDPTRLQQVVWNLLSNAIKFTPAPGHVYIDLILVDSQVQIQVRDTGKGISADFLPNVFQQFAQADDSSGERRGGLGLGLAISKHLVEAHGGEISAASAGKGKGATFTVKLPLRPAQPSSGSVE
jgi:signal transduction histidine kinase/CheY-like chemotaxis protein